MPGGKGVVEATIFPAGKEDEVSHITIIVLFTVTLCTTGAIEAPVFQPSILQPVVKLHDVSWDYPLPGVRQRNAIYIHRREGPFRLAMLCSGVLVVRQAAAETTDRR